MTGAEREELVALTRQFAILVGSSIPVDQALTVFKDQAECPRLAKAFEVMRDKVVAGSRMSTAAAMSPEIFSTFYVAMLRVGEESGRLDLALDRMAGYLERGDQIRKKLRSALTYPCFILGLTALLTLVVFYTVLPTFVSMFDQMGAKLPLPTQVLMSMTRAIQSPGFWLVVLALGLEGWMVKKAVQSSPKRMRQFLELVIHLPILGSLLVRAAVARFAGSVQTLLVCGITLNRSLLVAAEASDNPLIQNAALDAVEKLKAGAALSVSLAAYPDLFPGMVPQMVKLGEETGQMTEVFLRINTFYSQELDYKIEALTAALEPLLLATIAFVVGFIVISIFLPLYGTLSQFS